jgi:Carboxypeptidase regulatory-like domain/TonB-dependent Receptor Plug Domain
MYRIHVGSARRAFLVAAAFAASLLLMPAAARAQTTTFLAGDVTSPGAGPVGGADVVATGANTVVRTRTDARGHFVFSALSIGTYNVDVSAPAGRASLRVDLTGSGATVTVALDRLKEIGRTAVTSRPPVRGSGTDVSLNAETLARSPAGGKLSELLVQLPGAARGANGVVHINGDHGDINYVVDGVPIPQELNRAVGSEFDPNDIAFVEALQGAYPAQYGERFASVINVNTRTGTGTPGFTASVTGGSYALADTDLGYHTQIGTGSLVAAARTQRSGRGLDPPNFDSPHNAFSSANQFLRFTQPLGPNFLNLTVSHTYQTYQIPPDVASGAPASTDDNQTQDDLFATLQFRHPIGDRGSLSFGTSFKRSRIRDFGDARNDFTYGAALNPGAPGDCAQALLASGPVAGGVVTAPVANPAVSYVNGSCAFSLFSNRTAADAGANLDYANRSDKHELRFGALYDATSVNKRYDVTLQPGNFLAPIFTPGTPGAAYTVVDSSPNTGHLLAVYLQDSWKMGTAYQLDYGVRANAFGVASAQFSSGFGQVSPRIKLTRFFGPRNSVYAFYGRFFTPFSLENVSPLAAYTLNLPVQSSIAQFDLKPQRDSVYELGGHVALGRGDVGVRIMQKNATDLIDDTQVGTTNLHQDINYAQGRIATQTAYYQLGLARGGRFYASLTHTYSVNRGCETQLLAPCFGSPGDWTPADHDQRVDVSSGTILNDRRGGWFSMTGEYGSGLSSASCPAAQTSPCKRTPHLTFDVEKGIALQHGIALTFAVGNVFNDRYLVTFANAQGNHYARPRTFELGLRLNGK